MCSDGTASHRAQAERRCAARPRHPSLHRGKRIAWRWRNHALLIGLVSGLIGFVPYVGSLTGLLLSVSIAIVQFGPTWTPVLIVLGIFIVGQSVADYVLAPYLVGSQVHLNPVWLIFSLFAFGYLFGLVGLLIAVPLAASIGVLVRFALTQAAEVSQTAPLRNCRAPRSVVRDDRG
jgi:predicted PurR-regulated permease PerM